MKSISNAGLVNKFRNICGGGGRNWQRDGFGWVTRQGLVWLAQGGGLRVQGDRGRDGRGTGVGWVTQVPGGQRLARGQGRRQTRVKGAGEGLGGEVGVHQMPPGLVTRGQEGATGAGTPVKTAQVTGGEGEVGDGADAGPPDHDVVLETPGGPGLHHGVEIGVVVGGAGVIGGVVTRRDRGGVAIGVLGRGGGGAPGVGAQGRARPAHVVTGHRMLP